MKRKQFLKNSLVNFVKETKGTNEVYQVQTDINKVYFLHNGNLHDGNVFNLKASAKIKTSTLNKDTVYYVTLIEGKQLELFNI
jgi:hypothetical protein